MVRHEYAGESNILSRYDVKAEVKADDPFSSFGRDSNGAFNEKGSALAAVDPIAVAAIALAIEAFVPTPMFAAHQSMNGDPRCGVPIDVRDKGVYVSGLRWEMRYRTSRPPIE